MVKLQELMYGNSSKVLLKKPSLSDTYKADKSYREEIHNLHTLIDSKNLTVDELGQKIEDKKEELLDVNNKNNLEYEQAELLQKEYLDYEQAIKVASLEAKNAEQGALEKKEILEKLSLEENVLRKELIDIQDAVSSSNANLANVSIIANDKVLESNTAQQKLDSAISNLKEVEENLGVRTSSLRELETVIGDKIILNTNLTEEITEKQKELVPIDELLLIVREKQELVFQLTAQASELRNILDEGASLSLSFESTLEEAETSFRLTMEETDKKQRLRHRLLLAEIKDLEVILAEKSDNINNLNIDIQNQKDDIEFRKEEISELVIQERRLKESMEDVEFRKCVKTSPEVSAVPTLGLSESPFHKKTGVS